MDCSDPNAMGQAAIAQLLLAAYQREIAELTTM